MFNRLTNVFAESASSAENRWQTDGRPAMRLLWLGVLMLLPMAAIGARVAYLQTSTAALFAQPFEQEYISYESVPSRDGRLLSADGRVLATDRQQFSVKVHYRWLEEPADPAWLKSQALSRLAKSERRNPELIARLELWRVALLDDPGRVDARDMREAANHAGMPLAREGVLVIER